MAGGPADLDGIQEVDRLSFPSPWTRAMYEEELRHAGTAFIIVLRTGATPRRPATAPTASSPARCRSTTSPSGRSIGGAGSAGPSWNHALEHGRAAGALTALLEVRRSNLAAQRLYLSLGFVQVGERRRYYSHPEEDALVLARDVRNLGWDPAA